MNEQERLYNWFKRRELDDIREQMLKETRLDKIIKLGNKYQRIYNFKFEDEVLYHPPFCVRRRE